MTTKSKSKIKVKSHRAFCKVHSKTKEGKKYCTINKPVTQEKPKTKLIWITTMDERACNICWARHGKIYAINRVPGPAHENCRCNIFAI